MSSIVPPSFLLGGGEGGGMGADEAEDGAVVCWYRAERARSAWRERREML